MWLLAAAQMNLLPLNRFHNLHNSEFNPAVVPVWLRNVGIAYRIRQMPNYSFSYFHLFISFTIFPDWFISLIYFRRFCCRHPNRQLNMVVAFICVLCNNRNPLFPLKTVASWLCDFSFHIFYFEVNRGIGTSCVPLPLCPSPSLHFFHRADVDHIIPPACAIPETWRSVLLLIVLLL